MDFAEEVALGAVAANPVLLWVAPTHAAPDVTFDVAAHAIGKSGCEALGENFSVDHFARGDVDVEDADMSRTTMGDAAVNDV